MNQAFRTARSLLVLALGAYACESTPPPDDDEDGGSTSGGAAAKGGAAGKGGSTRGGAAGAAKGGAATQGGSTSGGSGGEGGTGGVPGGAGQSEGGAHAGDSSGASAGVGASGGTSGGTGTTSGGAGSAVGGSGGLEGGAAGSGGEGGEGGGAPDDEDPNLTWLGPCSPVDLSADGETVLASEGVWNRASGWTPLPKLPGADRNYPMILSADGHVVFGCSGSAAPPCQLYRWTREDGIQGLGRPYVGSSEFADTMGTNADGSTLVTCGQDDTEDANALLLRWTQSESFQVVEMSLPQPNWFACAHGSATLSSNGRTIAVDVLSPSDLNDVFTLRTRPPLPGESGAMTRLYEYFNNAHNLVVTALSGDGGVVAIYQWADSTVQSDLCVVAPDCDWERNVLEDLSYDGSSGVGRALSMAGGVGAPEPQSRAPIYWSQATDIQYVGDALAERGIVVDPPSLSRLALSEDGRSLLGVSTRHHLDGSTHDECFLATLQEPTQTAELPALPASCGNGLVEAGEVCDDGNLNNMDACSARCQRIALAAGGATTCALHHGRVECWGTSADIRGPGEVSRGWAPVEIPGTDGAIQLAISYHHGCVVREGGTVRCWGGSNVFGELGDGSTNPSHTAVDVVGLTNVVQVTTGLAHSCALLANGSVRCWGNNSRGQLGNGTTSPSVVPVEVSNLTNAVQLDAKYRDSTCALLADATVSCWGYMDPVTTTVPSAVAGLSNVREIVSMSDFTYALLFDGTQLRWYGDNSWGFSSEDTNGAQIGGSDLGGLICYLLDGSINCFHSENSFAERGTGYRYGRGGAVAGIRNAVQVVGGADAGYACASLATGEVRCWGNNRLGQLGNGTRKTNFPEGVAAPVAVKGFP